MKRLSILFWVALLWIDFGTVTAVFPQEKLVHRGRYFWGEFVKRGDIGKSGTLKIRAFKGDVRILGWNQKQFEIREKIKMDIFTRSEAEKALALAKSDVSVSGKTIQIDGTNFRSWMSGDVSIKVPRNFSSRVNVRGGDISVRFLRGNQSLGTSGGDVALEDLRGNIQARSSGGDISARKIKGALAVATSGGDLHLVQVSGTVSGSTSGGDILVKNCADRISVSTSGGDIEASAVDGDLNAMTSGGDIDVRDAEARVRVQTSGGDLSVSHVSQDVVATTSGGDIKVENALQKVQAKTSGGDVFVRGVGGPVVAYTSGGEIRIQKARSSVNAKTSGGNVFVEMTPEDFTVPHWAKIYSSGGDLTLVLPRNLPATISAVIKVRNHRLRDLSIKSDFPLKIERTEKSDWNREIRATGDINGGGDKIELGTVDGNIEIRKE